MSEINQWWKVVAKFQQPLRLHDGDITTILHRFAYLKQNLAREKQQTGIRDMRLVLTSVYCYARTPSNGRKIVGPFKFVSLCKSFEFDFTQRDLWRYKKLYYQYELYSQAPTTNAVTYFNAAWYDIAKDLNLPETAKAKILSLLGEAKKLKGSQRSVGIIVGAIIRLLGGKLGRYFTQSELAEYFGVSEVSLRNAEHDLESLFGGNEDVKP